MAKNTTAIGSQAEAVAADYLTAQGYQVIARNDRTRFAELDIIVRDKCNIVFVEVKYRKYTDFGGGAGAITQDKLRRLQNASAAWLQEHGEYSNLQPRIDVITVEGDLARPSIIHIDNVSIDIT